MKRAVAVCGVCSALVADPESHQQWHGNIAGVAIETTARVERLEEQSRGAKRRWPTRAAGAWRWPR